MKKSLIALAIMGTVSGAAMAQSSVNLYGIMDLGFSHQSNGGDSINGIDSGLQSGSRLGLKGVEDLGNGLKATFVLESGIQADTGGYSPDTEGKAFGRQAWLGLEGGFGGVRLGRQHTPIRETLERVDPFALGSAGALNRVALDGFLVERVNNAVTYSLPRNSTGLVGSVQYGFGETPGSNSANNAVGLNLGYKLNALDVELAYSKHNARVANLDSDLKTWALGATYDFGPAKAHALVAQQKLDDSGLGQLHKSRSYMVGVSAPFGPHTVKASYIINDVRSLNDADSKQLALGYEYAMSKRTNFYTTVARLNNDGNADLQVTRPGANSTVYQVGMRHMF